MGHMFDDVDTDKPPRVSDLRAAGRLIKSLQPSPGSYSASGQRLISETGNHTVPASNDWFPVSITSVSPSSPLGFMIVGFVEVGINPDQQTESIPSSGNIADEDRVAVVLGGGTVQPNQIALARRSRLDPTKWEVFPGGGVTGYPAYPTGGPAGTKASFTITVEQNPRCSQGHIITDKVTTTYTFTIANGQLAIVES